MYKHNGRYRHVYLNRYNIGESIYLKINIMIYIYTYVMIYDDICTLHEYAYLE